LASKIDPSDPRINGKQVIFSGNTINYCRICQSTVGFLSKHCAKCDKCVEEFDHHCDWLNTCIGKRNYRIFFTLSAFMSAVVFLKTGIAIYLIIFSGKNDENFQIPESFKEKDEGKYVILIIISAIKDPFLLILLVNLVAFHVWLRIQGVSTYEYLMSRKHGKSLAVMISSRKGKEAKNDMKKTGKIQKIQKKQEKIDKKHEEIDKKQEKIEKKQEEIDKNKNKNQNNQISENSEKCGKTDENNEKTQIKEKNEKFLNLEKDIIFEELELNFTKESIRVGDRMEGMRHLDEIKVKKPLSGFKQNQSQRSGDMCENDEESLNLSGKNHKKTFKNTIFLIILRKFKRNKVFG